MFCKRALVTLIWSCWLSSCGGGSSSGGKASSPVPEQSTQPTSEASTSKSEIQPTSYYVTSVSELATCDDKSRGFLVYVKSLDQFKACLDSGWITVDIKGKDGSNGLNGKDAAANDNTWTDPITGRLWLVGVLTTYTVAYQSGCPSGYTMPSPTEAKTAALNGLMDAVKKINGGIYAWTQKRVYTLGDVGSVYLLTAGNIATYNANTMAYISATATLTAATDGFIGPVISSGALICYKN